MRMASKAARVSRRNGSTVRGPPSVLSLYCDQTLRRSCSGWREPEWGSVEAAHAGQAAEIVVERAVLRMRTTMCSTSRVPLRRSGSIASARRMAAGNRPGAAAPASAAPVQEVASVRHEASGRAARGGWGVLPRAFRVVHVEPVGASASGPYSSARSSTRLTHHLAVIARGNTRRPIPRRRASGCAPALRRRRFEQCQHAAARDAVQEGAVVDGRADDAVLGDPGCWWRTRRCCRRRPA